jgi:SHAQKYF class myb-like DNA-binding protein
MSTSAATGECHFTSGLHVHASNTPFWPHFKHTRIAHTHRLYPVLVQADGLRQWVQCSGARRNRTSPVAEGLTPLTPTPQEHAAFEEGLRTFGSNWRRVQALVPTRTLVQIRTHAQKFFIKTSGAEALANGVASEGARDDVGGKGVEGGLWDVTQLTVRHIALEPLHPLQPLGLALEWRSDLHHCIISGIESIDAAVGGNAGGGATASSSAPLLRIGDVLLGVSGMSTINLGPSSVLAAIAASRSAVPGGLLVLHLSDMGFEPAEVVEAAVQMASAAATLLGAQSYVELAQAAQQAALFASVRQLPA